MSALAATDYAAVKRLFCEIFDLTEDKYLPAVWRERDVSASRGIWKHGALVAAALVRGNCLEYIFVSPAAQGDGYGSTLLAAVLEKRPALHLTPVNDGRVIRWYERHGFHLSSQEGDRRILVRHTYALRPRSPESRAPHLMRNVSDDRDDTTISRCTA